MIVLSIAHSSLSWFSPVDCVFCYLARVECIWCEAIVVLVNNDDTYGLSLGIIIDLEKYGNVFSVRKCLSIVSLPVEAGYHHSLVVCEIFGFGFFDEVRERDTRLPISSRITSSVWYSLCECNTLTIIPHLRELREELITRILHTSRIRRVGYHIDILTIHSDSWHSWIMTSEDFPFWNNSFLPKTFWDSCVIPRKRECKWGLDEWHYFVERSILIPRIARSPHITLFR